MDLTEKLNEALLEEVKENEVAIAKLEEKEKKHVQIIKDLKQKIGILEAYNQEGKTSNIVETQTETEFQEIPCHFCIYSASCYEELDWHLDNNHGQEEPSESDTPSPFTCNICCKKNSNRGELLRHKKHKHPEAVRTCKYFLAGKCDFPENACWFIQTKTSIKPVPQTLVNYTCGVCKKVYQVKSDFMNHRNNEHIEIISE
jgi:hypothetical protein